jgi:uncharacterized protein YbcV (DUF1398 family)
MRESTKQTIEKVAHACESGSIHFPEVVKALIEVEVESYHADFRTETTTYYLPDGDIYKLALKAPDVPIADTFDAQALQRAVRGAQSAMVMYPEFVRLSRAAGCIGYVTWIRGSKVTYFGRAGDEHVEHFLKSASD